MLEGTLSKHCQKYFESLGSKCLAIKKHQSNYAGRRGISDWIICYRGYPIYLELKVGDNKPSALQLHFLEDAKAAGAITAVCYFLEEVKEVFNRIDREIATKRLGG